MHRIDTPTAQADKFGQGKNGFTNGDPATGRRATDLNSDMWDAVQEEICTAIESAGLTLDKTKHDQLYQAIVKIITSKIPDALLRQNNLSDVVDKALARANLELGTAATKNVQQSRDDTTAGRVLVNGGAVAVRTVSASAGAAISDANELPANSVSFCYSNAANSPGYDATILDVGSGNYRVQYAASYSDGGKRLKYRTLNGDNNSWGNWYECYHNGNKPTAVDVNAVPTRGGPVGYLYNSLYYKSREGAWQGIGGFNDQLSNSMAPFVTPLYSTPKDISIYLPIVKGISNTDARGYTSAVSFGILRTGGDDFGTPVIHCIGDDGQSSVWYFDPVTGNVRSDKVGFFSTQNDSQIRADKAYNDAVSWVKSQFSLNFTSTGWWHKDITGKITQGGTVIGNGGYVNTNFPVTFPNRCLQVQMTLANGDFNNSKDNVFVNAVSNSAFQAVMHTSEYGAYWIAEGY
jgi:hypothetical protein